MGMGVETPWRNGWEPGVNPHIGFARVDAGDGDWVEGRRPYLEYRDMELDRASQGKLGGWHVRYRRDPTEHESWQADDLDFGFLYLLAGALTIAAEGYDEHVLETGGAVCFPRLQRYQVKAISKDFEAIQITVPAQYESYFGRETKLPELASRLGDRDLIVTHDTADQYVSGEGPRSFFEYRDTGARDVSQGRIHVHVIHALGTDVEEGTGWHYHSMAQWMMVIGGGADMRFEDHDRRRLAVFDSMCVGSGPTMRHCVDRVSGDNKVLELCVPAEYETVRVEAPLGSAE